MAIGEQMALEQMLIRLAPVIDRALNPQLAAGGERENGFVLVGFGFGEAGAPLAYITNAQASGLATALRELLRRLDETARIVTVSEGDVAKG